MSARGLALDRDPLRLVLVKGIANVINAETIKCARLQPDITSMGEFNPLYPVDVYTHHKF